MEINDFINKLADQFDETDVSAINPDTVLRSLGEWSSLIGLSILNMIEQEYGVSLTFDEFRQSITVSDLFDITEKKLQ